ncbi:ribonuclease-III-like-domain-containing protein [Glomus cerebriforme]|uniref:Ribonuclease-III-like-domain-containing protein n=1 Tax=Glomus cerebriforme TaxID=658196 RepID=A0A397T3Z2_9GLOM|nr:ribonuclease-III-like-domain-containing protein [Glomus cerebriforme]
MLSKALYSRITLKYSLTNFARQLHIKQTQNVTKPITTEATRVKDKHDEFCQKIDLKFSDSNLIHQVCTHKSVRLVASTNERLDFLGKKVIQLYAAEYFIDKIPPENLNDQIKLYTYDLNKLGKIGINLGLNELLYWTPINEAKIFKAKEEGREIPPSGEESVTGKALRALVGAIYHDKV